MTALVRLLRLLMPLIGRAVVAAVTLLISRRRKPADPTERQERR